MDLTAISQLGANLWPVILPFIGAGLTKATEKIGESIPGKIWQAIQGKFEAKTDAKKVLIDLQANPKDPDVQGAFRYQLKQFLQEDASFAASLSQLLSAAGSDFKGQVIGDGALAQGAGAKAVGARGVLIEGNATGNHIHTGDRNQGTDK